MAQVSDALSCQNSSTITSQGDSDFIYKRCWQFLGRQEIKSRSEGIRSVVPRKKKIFSFWIPSTLKNKRELPDSDEGGTCISSFMSFWQQWYCSPRIWLTYKFIFQGHNSRNIMQKSATMRISHASSTDVAVSVKHGELVDPEGCAAHKEFKQVFSRAAWHD